jgi:hypothetical protein
VDADGGYPVFYDGWTRQSGDDGNDGNDGNDEDNVGGGDALDGGLDDHWANSGDRGEEAVLTGSSGASAYHHVIVGETGSGKTYGAHLLLYREALRGTQVVVLEPMGHSRRLMQAMGEGGSYNRVDFAHATLNVLDVVETTLTDQVTHVQRALAVLLSSASGAGGAAASPLGGHGPGGRGDAGGRRVFRNAELAALGAALRDLYTGINPHDIRPQ